MTGENKPLAIILALILTAFAQGPVPPHVKLPGTPLPRLGPIAHRVIATPVAYDWFSHTYPSGPEGIYYETLVLRVDKVIKGDLTEHFVVVQFFANSSYPPRSKLYRLSHLPESMFKGLPWELWLAPRNPISAGECGYPIEAVATVIVQEEGKETITHPPAFRPTLSAYKDFPDPKSLSCYSIELKSLIREIPAPKKNKK